MFQVPILAEQTFNLNKFKSHPITWAVFLLLVRNRCQMPSFAGDGGEYGSYHQSLLNAVHHSGNWQ